jgi:ABC-2 type transport system ATP-binding protein
MGRACRQSAENHTPGGRSARLLSGTGAGSVILTGKYEEEHRMIEVNGLTKKYGSQAAVDGLSFTVRPGIVTGFLGPNGAGKSTTMRMILGLAAPTSGSVTVNGKTYRDHTAPLHEVGALLEARSAHPRRSACHHLLSIAQTSGISRSRVEEVIDAVGLHGVSKRRAGKFSLGMTQRLGIAAALLGDPQTVILDEPLNGLDTDGIRWVRSLLRSLAAEGRTVFVSSHMMNEMALTADHLIVIGRGRLLADTSTADFTAQAGPGTVRVRSTDPGALAARLHGAGVTVTPQAGGELEVTGMTTGQIGAIAMAAGITVLGLAEQQTSLEEAFITMTQDAAQFRAPQTTGANR